MSRFCILFILILLAGCSSITGRVEGWPAMEVNIHESHLLEINQKCYAYLPVAYKLAGALSFGCAIYDLNKNTCDIYVAAGAPDFIVQHEMAHCTGADHGDHDLQIAFDRWLDANEKVGSKPADEPPRLVLDSFGSGFLTWDHSSRFGPVPQELVDSGELECAKNDLGRMAFKAIGYHPLAQDADGQALMGGGFYCLRD